MWKNEQAIKCKQIRATVIAKAMLLLFLSFFVLAGVPGSMGRPLTLAASAPDAQTGQQGIPLVDARPPKMAYQPPVDASILAEFAPPAATQVTVGFEGKESQAGESSVDPLELSQTLTTVVNPAADTAVNFRNGLLGVIVEKDTFAQPVTLTFTPSWVSDLSEPAALNVEGLPQKDGGMIHRGEEKLFQFQIEVTTDGRTVAQFEKPVRLVVDLRTFGHDLGQTGGKFFLVSICGL